MFVLVLILFGWWHAFTVFALLCAFDVLLALLSVCACLYMNVSESLLRVVYFFHSLKEGVVCYPLLPNPLPNFFPLFNRSHSTASLTSFPSLLLGRSGITWQRHFD